MADSLPSEKCAAVVYRRDTYRYTDRVKGGFEMHYNKGQCSRRAYKEGYCRQHARLRGIIK